VCLIRLSAGDYPSTWDAKIVGLERRRDKTKAIKQV
jgi:hypothetical protein